MEIEENAVHDSINEKKYIGETTKVVQEMFTVVCRMFEQGRLRWIAMIIAAEHGSYSGAGEYANGITEHKMIQHLKAVTGDRTIFRQVSQHFATGLGQV
jgi:hypothetical protein